jgi:hypothetical protein
MGNFVAVLTAGFMFLTHEKILIATQKAMRLKQLMIVRLM